MQRCNNGKGYIHQPEIREIKSSVSAETVTYLNSGDWVESLTALEYYAGKWEIFDFQNTVFTNDNLQENPPKIEPEGFLDVRNLLEQFRTEL